MSITPFGRKGPWVHRPWTELILQALCGSTASRVSSNASPYTPADSSVSGSVAPSVQ